MSSPRTVSQVQTQDKDVNQLQQNLKQALDPIQKNPLIYGNIVTQNIVSGQNMINHGLGRPLQGWIIVGINGAAQIYDNQAGNADSFRTLILVSNANVRVSVYCF